MSRTCREGAELEMGEGWVDENGRLSVWACGPQTSEMNEWLAALKPNCASANS